MRSVSGKGSKDREAKGRAEGIDECGTTEGGKLTNNAGMLLKNRATQQARCGMAIAKLSSELGPAEETMVGVEKKRRKRPNEANI
jgi:hypothetical protein